MVNRIKPLVIFVTGDRNWDDFELMDEAIGGFPEKSWLLQGGAKGADAMAVLLAQRTAGYFVLSAPYHKYAHRAGGPARNRMMGELLTSFGEAGHPITAHAFHNNITESRGTADMISRLRSLGIPHTLHHRVGKERLHDHWVPAELPKWWVQ